MPNPKETVNQTASRIETNFKLDFQYLLLLELFVFNFLKIFLMYKKQLTVEEKFTFLISIFKFLRILDRIILKLWLLIIDLSIYLHTL